MNNRITQIIDVQPFSIKCKWTNGEIRLVDFLSFQKNIGGGKVFEKIMQPEIFKQVKLDEISHTLYWADMLPYRDYDGSTKIGALDFCPDVLYFQSVAV